MNWCFRGRRRHARHLGGPPPGSTRPGRDPSRLGEWPSHFADPPERTSQVLRRKAGWKWIRFILVPDKEIYRQGETAKVLLVSPWNGNGPSLQSKIRPAFDAFQTGAIRKDTDPIHPHQGRRRHRVTCGCGPLRPEATGRIPPFGLEPPHGSSFPTKTHATPGVSLDIPTTSSTPIRVAPPSNAPQNKSKRWLTDSRTSRCPRRGPSLVSRARHLTPSSPSQRNHVPPFLRTVKTPPNRGSGPTMRRQFPRSPSGPSQGPIRCLCNRRTGPHGLGSWIKPAHSSLWEVLTCRGRPLVMRTIVSPV